MRWPGKTRRKRPEAEISDEIESYLAIETEKNLVAGMSPQEAAWAAQRKFGNVTAYKETSHDMNTPQWIEGSWQDLRYGARVLKTNPGFLAVAVASLALGIGANTAIFQLLDSVRLRMLPVPHAEQIAEVKIAENSKCCTGNFTSDRPYLTFAQWEQIRSRQEAFSGLFAWSNAGFNISESGEVHNIRGVWVTGDFFNTLGVEPLMGRLITRADDKAGCASPGVVISYPFWQRQFGGDSQVLGKALSLDRHRVEVMGVTPPDFYGVTVGQSFDVAIPVCAEPWLGGENARTRQRMDWWLAAFGRLKPGWTIARAAAQMKAVSRPVFENTVPEGYRPDTAKDYLGYQLTVVPAGSGSSSLRDDYSGALVVLLAISGLVLLIACANLANLMLARASAREREMAIRLAIGAGRGRLIRQLLAESLLLTAIGTGIGILLARVLSSYLVKFLSTEGNELFLDTGLNWHVLGFTAGVAILTCVLFGLTPALRATQTAPASAMRASSRGLTADRERFGLRRVLVIGQVALSLVLLVGALLFTGSLHKLMTTDAGFRQEGMLVANVNITAMNYSPERRGMFFRDLLERVRALPGVESAATVAIVQATGSGWNDIIEIIGHHSSERMVPWMDRVSPGYFRTMGTPLLAGRDFNAQDTATSQDVAIVNQAFAQKYLGGASPLGKQYRILHGPGEPDHIYQIVGMVKNSKYLDLRRDIAPVAFVPASQEPKPSAYGNIIVRSSLPLASLTNGIKQVALNGSPQVSLQFTVFQTQLWNSLLRDRLMATLSGFFGFLAAVLAAVGLYGVISYMVARRRNEIGIRVALGASRGDVMRLVLREVGILLVIGLAIGTGMAFAAGRQAASLLYGLKPGDPLILTFAVVLMATVALLASFVPTLQACRMEPMTALREE